MWLTERRRELIKADTHYPFERAALVPALFIFANIKLAKKANKARK